MPACRLGLSTYLPVGKSSQVQRFKGFNHKSFKTQLFKPLKHTKLIKRA